MTRHTPGPWTVTEDVVGRTHVDSQYAGPGRDYTPVADVHQGKADARLIAVAPAMKQFIEEIARHVYGAIDEEGVTTARALLAQIERQT